MARREPDRLVYDDRMIHCCLYFIAPHRLKHIDVAFMRRLHRWVNIVPIIGKSDADGAGCCQGSTPADASIALAA